MIFRVRDWARVPTAFKGGPAPRVPDSLFPPMARPTRIPLAFTVNTMFGIGPDLHKRIPRQVCFNVQNGQVQIFQPKSRQTTSRPHVVTIRQGPPNSMSYLVPPIG